MIHDRRPFRYGPDALLQQQRWEVQLLSADAQRALQLLESQRARLRQCLEAVAGTEDALRSLYATPGGIPLEQRALLQAYLDHLRRTELAQRQQVAVAESRQEQILSQLHANRVSVRSMEIHRERKRLAHECEVIARDIKAADDQWLLSRRHGGARVLVFSTRTQPDASRHAVRGMGAAAVHESYDSAVDASGRSSLEASADTQSAPSPHEAGKD